MQTLTHNILKSVCLMLTIIFISSCSGPEEKKMKFFDKGTALFEQGDLVKARLEFKNTLQIDPSSNEFIKPANPEGGSETGSSGLNHLCADANALP